MKTQLHTVQDLAQLTGIEATDNLRSIHEGLVTRGEFAGLHLPHRLIMYLAQIAHESVGFRYDREIWGPTRAQAGYEGRKDLGNIYPGDGKKFSGHTAMQITGRYNTTEFLLWCRTFLPYTPDFLMHPELMNTDPYEGLGPIWFWETNGLNRYADSGAFATLTLRINGGTNGHADRCNYYTRFGLIALGYPPTAVREFQSDYMLKPDGIAGEKTRQAIHAALTELPPVTFQKTNVVVAPVMSFFTFLMSLFGAKK